ncbi:MAG: hypothetical protein O2779_02760 [Nanoarchaeota archaeon]|nr:hypothetical protein [Nanoarchaeota archaeon]
MFEHFRCKGLHDRLKDTLFVLKHSFSVIGKDNGIMRPAVHAAFFSFFITTLFFFSLFVLFLREDMLLGWIGIASVFFIFLPWRYVYIVRQKACTAVIAYAAVGDHAVSYRDSYKHTHELRNHFGIIAMIDFMLHFSGRYKSHKRGMLAGFLNKLCPHLADVQDLLSHYMLPAVIIEGKSLHELADELKSLKEAVPEDYHEAFGVDFSGHVVGHFLFVPMIILFSLSLFAGYQFPYLTQDSLITVAGYSFSWLPPLLVLYVVFIAKGILQIFVEMSKVIYYTLFYAQIREQAHIVPTFRHRVRSFLIHNRETPPGGKHRHRDFTEHHKKVANYVHTQMQAGHTEQDIHQHLVDSDYDEHELNRIFDYVRHR